MASIDELMSVKGIKQNSAIFLKLLGDTSKYLYRGDMKRDGPDKTQCFQLVSFS